MKAQRYTRNRKKKKKKAYKGRESWLVMWITILKSRAVIIILCCIFFAWAGFAAEKNEERKLLMTNFEAKQAQLNLINTDYLEMLSQDDLDYDYYELWLKRNLETIDMQYYTIGILYRQKDGILYRVTERAVEETFNEPWGISLSLDRMYDTGTGTLTEAYEGTIMHVFYIWTECIDPNIRYLLVSGVSGEIVDVNGVKWIWLLFGGIAAVIAIFIIRYRKGED